MLPSLWEAVAGTPEITWSQRDDEGRFLEFSPEFGRVWRWKDELPERRLVCVGKHVGGRSALVSLELLSRGHPRPVNDVRPLLHTLANADDNEAVRRLALVCLRNGSPQRDTIVILQGLAEDDEADRQLRDAARRVAAELTKKARARQ